MAGGRGGPGVELGTHLTPWRVLNVTPTLGPASLGPRVRQGAGSAIHHGEGGEAEVSSRRGPNFVFRHVRL